MEQMQQSRIVEAAEFKIQTAQNFKNFIENQHPIHVQNARTTEQLKDDNITHTHSQYGNNTNNGELNQKLSDNAKMFPFTSNLKFQSNNNSFFNKQQMMPSMNLIFHPNEVMKEKLNSVMLRDDYFRFPLTLLHIAEERSSYNPQFLLSSINMQQYQSNQCTLELLSLDSRVFTLTFNINLQTTFHLINKLRELLKNTRKVMCSDLNGQSEETFLPFEFYKTNSQIEQEHKGWDAYNIQQFISQIQRQNISISRFDEFQQQNQNQNHNLVKEVKDYKAKEDIKYESQCNYQIIDNGEGQLCKSYPQFLIVPNQMSKEEIQECKQFRSNNRLPVLVSQFVSKSQTLVTLWRSSQNKPGGLKLHFIKWGNKRNISDEKMIALIGDPSLSNHNQTNHIMEDQQEQSMLPQQQQQQQQKINVHIYDARPYLQAVGNHNWGMGFEAEEHYRNMKIFFLGIENIHKVSKSFFAMLHASNDESNPEYFKNISQTNWMWHVSKILQGVNSIVDSLHMQCKSVLVHCSDGWDRTAQLVSLVQLCIDPYYRTIKGLQELITKDWIAFGHQFALRAGYGQRDKHQVSQIFILFLDCLYQLLIQFPLSFEYNNIYLVQLAHLLFDNRFGTFLCDSMKDVLDNKINERTVSVWSFLNNEKHKYVNPIYIATSMNENAQVKQCQILVPNALVSQLHIWKEFFNYFSPSMNNIYNNGTGLEKMPQLYFTRDNIDRILLYQGLQQPANKQMPIVAYEKPIQHKQAKAQNGKTLQGKPIIVPIAIAEKQQQFVGTQNLQTDQDDDANMSFDQIETEQKQIMSINQQNVLDQVYSN